MIVLEQPKAIARAQGQRRYFDEGYPRRYFNLNRDKHATQQGGRTGQRSRRFAHQFAISRLFDDRDARDRSRGRIQPSPVVPRQSSVPLISLT